MLQPAAGLRGVARIHEPVVSVPDSGTTAWGVPSGKRALAKALMGEAPASLLGPAGSK